jgi:hypothetical protein
MYEIRKEQHICAYTAVGFILMLAGHITTRSYYISLK